MKFDSTQFSLKAVQTRLAKIDRKVLIQNAIIVGAFLIFLLFFFFPVLMQNQKAGRDVKKLDLMLRTAGQKIAKIPEMKQQKELFGERTKRIRDQFFDLSQMDDLIEIVSTLASEARVRITASKPVSEENVIPAPFNQMYLGVSYDLTIEGPYHAIGAFINGLERYPKNFAVHKLGISKSDKTPAVHECGFILTAFLKRPPASTPQQNTGQKR